MFALTKILVPTNRGEPSKAAVKYGVAFARQFGARLFLVRVLSPEDYEAALETERVIETLLPDGSGQNSAPSAPSLEEVARNAAREHLGEMLDPDSERETQAEYLLRSMGRQTPGDALVACAKELDVELIVMGKHRIGFVEHLLAGSVTEKVVRQAPCPVLIVQHPEHEFVLPNEQSPD